MKKVRITVLRKEFYSDFADEYLTDGREAGPCALMNVGDSFIFEGGAQMPEGLCPWAWIDIYHSVSCVAAGGTYKPWNREDGQTIVCFSSCHRRNKKRYLLLPLPRTGTPAETFSGP